MKPNPLFTILLFVVGGILGVLIVRAFFLDPVEELGWRMFWEGLSNARVMNSEMVLKSTTFAKCVAGFLVGGLALAVLGIFLKKNATKTNCAHDAQAGKYCTKCGASLSHNP